MYDLAYYKEPDEQVIDEFIHDHPFAFLTGCDSAGKPVATQVPVFMEKQGGRKLLSGHIMKNTDHHEAFLQNKNVLVVFTGDHTYVSGAWYRDPYTPSTWNYMSVHAKGVIRFLDEKKLEEVLQKTSLYFEQGDEQSPTVFDNLPTGLKQNAMKQIVAFEIEVTETDNVFKLSQDRDPESHLNIIKKLKEQGEGGRVIAEEMEKRRKEGLPGGPE